MKRLLAIGFVMFVAVRVEAQATATNTPVPPTNTPANTATRTNTAVNTATPTVTNSPVFTLTPSRTATPTRTVTSTPTGPTPTPGIDHSSSHVHALEMTRLHNLKEIPTYSDLCNGGQTRPPDVCRCSLYFSLRGATTKLYYTCPDGVEHEVTIATPLPTATPTNTPS